MGRSEASKSGERREAPHERESHKLPYVSERQRLAIEVMLPRVRESATKIVAAYDRLRKEYPDDVRRVEREHPTFTRSLRAGRDVLDYISDRNRRISTDELLTMIDQYNHFAERANTVLVAWQRDIATEQERALMQKGREAVQQLTEQQLAEAKRFAKDLWEELFPATRVDRFAKWAGGQELEGYQKLLLAPANGIEWAVEGFVGLFQPKTWQELVAAVSVSTGMSFEEWCAAWRTVKFAYEHLPTADKIAPVISVLCSMAFLYGGATKIIAIAKQKGYSKNFVYALRTTLAARTVTYWADPIGKTLALGSFAGTLLPYIDVPRG